MPKRLELSPHASTEELEHRYRKAKDPVERSHRQIVWLLSEGRTTEEVCEVTGYSPTDPRDAYALRLAVTLGRLFDRSRQEEPTPTGN